MRTFSQRHDWLRSSSIPVFRWNELKRTSTSRYPCGEFWHQASETPVARARRPPAVSSVHGVSNQLFSISRLRCPIRPASGPEIVAKMS